MTAPPRGPGGALRGSYGDLGVRKTPVALIFGFGVEGRAAADVILPMRAFRRERRRTRFEQSSVARPTGKEAATLAYAAVTARWCVTAVPRGAADVKFKLLDFRPHQGAATDRQGPRTPKSPIAFERGDKQALLHRNKFADILNQIVNGLFAG